MRPVVLIVADHQVHDDRSSRRHGLDPVDDQVRQDLLELDGVADDDEGVRLRVHAKGHVLPFSVSLEQVDGSARQVDQVDAAALPGLPAAEVEQPSNDRGHAGDLAYDDPRVVDLSLARELLRLDLLGPALDHVERGPQLVGHACGEGPDGRQPGSEANMTMASVSARLLRVLIADDDGEMRSLLTERLDEGGFEVSEAADGAALTGLLAMAIQDESARPDVLVTDERMPHRHGLDVVEVLRGSGWKLRVVLITAFASPELHDRARSLDAVVLEKPFQLEDFAGVVRATLPPMSRRPVVLLADDDAVLRRFLSRVRREAGYEVVEAADGQEALELGARTHVDLLLTDLQMPRLEGDALARALLARRPTSRSCSCREGPTGRRSASRSRPNP